MNLESSFAIKVIRLFVVETKKSLQNIEQATHNADINSLFHCVHSLKSSGAIVGAIAISTIAKEAEALARTGENNALTDHPTRLRMAFEAFCMKSAVAKMLATSH